MNDLKRKLELLEGGKLYFIKGKELYHPVGFGQVERKKDYENYGKFIRREGDKFHFDNFTLSCDTKSEKFVTQVQLSPYITINLVVECDAEGPW